MTTYYEVTWDASGHCHLWYEGVEHHLPELARLLEALQAQQRQRRPTYTLTHYARQEDEHDVCPQ